MSYDGWKDHPDHLRREQEFRDWLQRRAEMERAVADKYPEVMELLREFYRRKDFRGV